MPRNARRISMLVMLLAPLRMDAASAAESFESTVLPFIQKYCLACHNDKSNSGGLDLKHFQDAESLRKSPDVWRRALKRIEAGQMPPGRAPHPAADELTAVTTWLKNELARQDSSALSTQPGSQRAE